MSAYYSRNQSYSRSHNAEVAEEEGRFPRTRAAAHLGLSVRAFDAACKAVGYRATEWHHVGKYANEVTYFDTAELVDNPDFWTAALAASSPAKRKQIAADFEAQRVAEVCFEFRQAVRRWTGRVVQFAENLSHRSPKQSPTFSSGKWEKRVSLIPTAGSKAARQEKQTLREAGVAAIRAGDHAAMCDLGAKLARLERAAKKADRRAAADLASLKSLIAAWPVDAGGYSQQPGTSLSIKIHGDNRAVNLGQCGQLLRGHITPAEALEALK